MIIFLYGQDTYRARQKLNEIVDNYKKAHKTGLNLRHFDLAKDSYQDFLGEFQAISIFAEKRLIILENTFSNEDAKKKILKNAEKLAASKDIFIFYEKEPSEKDNLFELLKQKGKYQEFKLLEGNALRSWALRELEKRKIGIDPIALKKLIDYVGNNLWQLSEEIKKIAAYKSKDKKKAIEEEDINLLVRPKIETDIFKTIDAISGKNKKKALFLIQKHIEKGDSPLYIFSMINFQFRNILTIKSRCQPPHHLEAGQIKKLSRELGLHPFVIKKSFLQSRDFSLEDLKSIYQNIFNNDLAIKTGKIAPDAALENLIAGI